MMVAPAYGRHLSNIQDPSKDKRGPHLSYHAIMDCTGALAEAERRDYRDWIARNVIGPPKATATHTVEQLIESGMVGLYAPAGAE